MAPLAKILSSDSYRARKSILVYVAILNGVVSVSVLYGWIINSTILKSIFPTLTPMNPVTAVCFFILSICFLCFAYKPNSDTIRKIAASATAALLLLVNGSMLLHYMFGAPLRLDRLLFTAQLGINRIAPTTASCFFLIGIALLAYAYIQRTLAVVRVLGITIMGISLYALVGYAYGIQPVYGIALLNPMALSTAALFFFIAAVLIVLSIKKFVVYVSISLLTIIFIAMAVFGFFSVVSFRSFKNQNTVNSQIHGSDVYQTDVNMLRTALLDAETGQRGYLLTGQQAYLSPYTDAVARVDRSLRNIATLPPYDMSGQQYRELQMLVRDKMNELAQTIDYKKANNDKASLALLSSGRGKSDLDAIRAVLHATDANLQRSLASKLKASGSQNQLSLLLLSISTVSILGLLLSCLYLVQEILKRQHIRAMASESQRMETSAKNYSLETEATARLQELVKVKHSLEQEVQKRTSELNVELQKSERLNSFMVNRELKMVELKKQLESIRAELKK